MEYTLDGHLAAVALINPNPGTVSAPLPDGSWQVLLRDEIVDLAASESVAGEISAASRTVTLLRAAD